MLDPHSHQVKPVGSLWPCDKPREHLHFVLTGRTLLRATSWFENRWALVRPPWLKLQANPYTAVDRNKIHPVESKPRDHLLLPRATASRHQSLDPLVRFPHTRSSSPNTLQTILNLSEGHFYSFRWPPDIASVVDTILRCNTEPFRSSGQSPKPS